MAVIRTKGTQMLLSIATVYTAIAQLVKITIPDQTRGDIEITELDDEAKRYLSGIKEGGVLEFEIHYDPEVTTHAALDESFDDGDTEAWRVLMVNESQLNFSGHINKWNPGTEANQDGKFVGKIGIRLDGTITIVP